MNHKTAVIEDNPPADLQGFRQLFCVRVFPLPDAPVNFHDSFQLLPLRHGHLPLLKVSVPNPSAPSVHWMNWI
jgi:hypothetical protein